MSRASTAAINAATDAIKALATFIGLNTADPGTTGASEVAAEARQAISWAATAAGSAANSSSATVNLPASTTVPYFGTWNGAAGGYTVGGLLSASLSSGASAVNVTFAAGSVSIATA